MDNWMKWYGVVTAMKLGNYARRSVWGKQSYIYWDDKLNKILTNSGNEICLDNLKTKTDWEIIHSKKYPKIIKCQRKDRLLMGRGVIDFNDLLKDYSEGQIEHYSEDFDGSKTKALLYLWLYNNFHTNSKEVTINNGRPMYKNLAETLSRIIKEQLDVAED